MFKTHILNINNITTDNDSYKSYLILLDTQDILQRKLLIEKILEDPFISYLSLQNVLLNKQEKKKIFNKITNDPKSSLMTLKNSKLSTKQRQEIIACILDDDQCALTAAQQNIVSKEEKEIIYEQFKEEYFLTNDVDTYYNRYKVFFDYISDIYKNRLIDLIIEKQRYDLAHLMLHVDEHISENLKDRLESICLMENLSTHLILIF
jgi:hypothetical protein